MPGDWDPYRLESQNIKRFELNWDLESPESSTLKRPEKNTGPEMGRRRNPIRSKQCEGSRMPENASPKG